MLAASLVIVATLAALLQSTLVAHTALTSVDGKHTAQLLTVGFPMSGADGKLLGTVMNSDPYWHHFRYNKVYLRAGEKSFPGGPRLLAEDPRGFPVKAPGPRPRYGWTTTFTLPGHVKVAEVELLFCSNQHRGGKDGPSDEPFATLAVQGKAFAAAKVPFRATMKATGRYRDALDDNQDRTWSPSWPRYIAGSGR